MKKKGEKKPLFGPLFSAAAFGAQCDFEFTRNYPPTINTPYEAEFCRRVMTGIVGEGNAVPQEPTPIPISMPWTAWL